MAKALTMRSVEAAKAAGSRLEVPDSGLPGLYLVVQASGKKSWALRYRWLGRPAKLTLGAYPVTGLASARHKAREALQQLEDGLDPRAVRTAPAPETGPLSPTIDAAIGLFIERHAKVRNRAWVEVERVLKREYGRAWAGRRIDDIARRDVIELIDGIVDRGAPIMANRTLAHGRKWFAWLVSRDLLAASPFEGVAAPGPESRRDRVLSDRELAALWHACDDAGPPFGPLVQLLILLGQRRDEVGQMRWQELDFDQRLWTISAARAKNGKEHLVPLPDAAVHILERCPRIEPAAGASGSGFVFSTTGRNAFSGYSRAKHAVDRRMTAMLADEGATDGVLPHWQLHDLRRTMATGMQRLGIRLEVVEAILNHTSGSRAGVVGIYQRHDWAAEKRDALEAWAERVRKLKQTKFQDNRFTELDETGQENEKN